MASATVEQAAEPPAASTEAEAEAEAEPQQVSTVSTTASSDDEHSAAKKAESQTDGAASAFSFSMNANEFVPGKAFQFNVGAAEFTPGGTSASSAGAAAGRVPGSPAVGPVDPVVMINSQGRQAGSQQGTPHGSPQTVPMQAPFAGVPMDPVVAVQESSASTPTAEAVATRALPKRVSKTRTPENVVAPTVAVADATADDMIDAETKAKPETASATAMTEPKKKVVDRIAVLESRISELANKDGPPSWADRLFRQGASPPTSPSGPTSTGGGFLAAVPKRVSVNKAAAQKDSPVASEKHVLAAAASAPGASIGDERVRGLRVQTTHWDEEVDDGDEGVVTDDRGEDAHIARESKEVTPCDGHCHEDEDEAEDEAGGVSAPTASLKLASQLGKPDSNGVIRYSVDVLKSLAEHRTSTGSCPASIPHSLRSAQDGEGADQSGAMSRKRYKIEFLMQFEKKAPCQELPSNGVQIPQDLRAAQQDRESTRKASAVKVGEDDWRTQSAKHQANMKDSKASSNSRTTPGGGRAGGKKDDGSRLPASENSWSSQQRARLDDHEVVTRKLKSILNKLTVEKFDALYQQLLECGIETKAEHIETLMREVFEKATTQHHFIEMYTCLCIRLNEWLKEDQGVGSETGEVVTFKRILLNQCQDSFEKYLKPPEGISDLVGEEQYEAKVKYKTRMLGNVKFVGQLLIHKVLSSKIIIWCAQELLQYASEETLETLCAFLATVGPTYDVKEWRCYDALDQIFGRVKELCSDTSSLPPRIRCLLKDVSDLREQDWERNSRSNEPDGPMSLSEVKSQWAKEVTTHEKRISGGGSNTASSSARPGDEWETATRRRGGGQPQLTRSATTQERSGQGNSSSASERRGRATPSSGAKKDGEWRKIDKSEQPSLVRAKTAPLDSPSKVADKSVTSLEVQRLGPLGTSGTLGSSSASTAKADPKESTPKQDFTEEARKLLSELELSHDVDGALQRIRELRIPEREQKAFVIELVSKIVEQRAGDRPSCWSFVMRLPGKETLQPAHLIDGFDDFLSLYYEDIVVDVPMLPQILKEEFLNSLNVAAASSSLSSEDVSRIRDLVVKATGGEDA